MSKGGRCFWLGLCLLGVWDVMGRSINEYISGLGYNFLLWLL